MGDWSSTAAFVIPLVATAVSVVAALSAVVSARAARRENEVAERARQDQLDAASTVEWEWSWRRGVWPPVLVVKNVSRRHTAWSPYAELAWVSAPQQMGANPGWSPVSNQWHYMTPKWVKPQGEMAFALDEAGLIQEATIRQFLGPAADKILLQEYFRWPTDLAVAERQRIAAARSVAAAYPEERALGDALVRELHEARSHPLRLTVHWRNAPDGVPQQAVVVPSPASVWDVDEVPPAETGPWPSASQR